MSYTIIKKQPYPISTMDNGLIILEDTNYGPNAKCQIGFYDSVTQTTSSVVHTSIITKNDKNQWIVDLIPIISNYINSDEIELQDYYNAQYGNYVYDGNNINLTTFSTGATTNSNSKFVFVLLEDSLYQDGIMDAYYTFEYIYTTLEDTMKRELSNSPYRSPNTKLRSLNTYVGNSTKRIPIHPNQLYFNSLYIRDINTETYKSSEYTQFSSPQSNTFNYYNSNATVKWQHHIRKYMVRTILQQLGYDLKDPNIPIKDLNLLTLDKTGEYDSKKYFTVVKEECYSYCLYYVNRLGGIDYRLCNPASKKNMGYKNTMISVDNRSINPGARNTISLLNDTNTNYVLKTGWLNEDENDVMEELISSPKVWIQDLSLTNNPNKFLYPVILTEPKFEFKMYRTDKMFDMTINCSIAKNKIRK